MSDEEQPAAPVRYELVARLQAQVARRLTVEAQRREARGKPAMSREDEQQLALTVIHAAVTEHLQRQLRAGAGEEIPAERDGDERLAAAVWAAMYGAGELQELLDDERVENIDINGCDEVWVTYATPPGQEKRPPQRYRPLAASDDDLVAIIQNLAARAGVNPRPWTPATPELDLRLPDGSRLSAVMSAGERPSVSIRRNRFPEMFLRTVPPAAVAEFRWAHKDVPPTLLELESIDETLASFLEAAVLARMNMIVCGATDSGKTTDLRALINVLAGSGERLIVIEKAMELGIRRHPHLHPNAVEWEMVLPDADDRGGLSMAALVQRSLRQNPSRCIVGEVLGPEIVAMLNAMSQGNDGSLSTLHANDSLSAIERIATYAAQHNGLDFDVTHSLIAGAIDFIVFVYKNPLMGDRRVVATVREIGAFDHDSRRVASHMIFAPDPVTGRAARTAYQVGDRRKKRLAGHGYADQVSDWMPDAES